MNVLDDLLYAKLNLLKEAVVHCKDFPNWDDKIADFPIEVRKSLKAISPDAVYHFNRQPFILFFDFTKNFNNEREKTLHRQIWCFDTAPVTFFVFADEIKIYNAFRYQRTIDRLTPIEIDNYEEVFSFWRLHSGDTWKWIQKTFYKNAINKFRVNQKLFENIKETRRRLTEQSQVPLEDTFANILILRLIFIRYLIDRGVQIEEFINGDTLEVKKQCFNKLIADKVRLYEFFQYLEKRFNGNLFDTKNDPELNQTHLDDLSQIFASYKKQLFLFDVFDFSIIPVEVISVIYESVIDPEKREQNSAIYTPSFLVDYILSQTVDEFLKDVQNSECKILDPACGSGIFLVQAYRRLVERNRNEYKNISDQRLVELAQRNLFGIDKDENALNVAAFSLYVALLDYKDPPEIQNFRLPKLLNTNLFESDFFDEEAAFNVEDVFANKQFDFILGNPPWGSKRDKHHITYINTHNIPVTDMQIAQSFLARTKDFVNKHTKCALIVTSTAFYNLLAQKFKYYFLSAYYINRIFDLSAVRQQVFPNKKNPAIIIFYQYAFGQNTEHNAIEHLSIKQNMFLKYFNTLVIERQDQKYILQKYFIEYDWMFKVALYGNTIDFHFLKRLSEYATVGSHIDNITCIFKGNGILKGTPKSEPFTFLEGLPIVATAKILPFFTSIDKNTPILTKEDTWLEAGRQPELFLGHHILLKRRTKEETQLVISYVNTTCAFWNSAYSITSNNCIEELKKIYSMFISELSLYFQFITSSNWGVATRPEIALEEYVSFPYVEIPQEDELITLVDEFIECIRSTSVFPIYLFQRINTIILEAYGVNEVEKDLIDYVLNVSRYQFQESKLDKLIRNPSKEDLRKYAKVFYDHFSHVYNEDGEYFQIQVYQMPFFVAMTFNIVETSPLPEQTIIFPEHNYSEQALLRTIAQTVSIHNVSNDIFKQKDVKGFEEDFFYVIKPNEYKCWHRAIAHYDLAEFIEQIENAELDQIADWNNE